MPELPEVETTVQELKKRVVGKKIVDFWTDWPKYYKKGALKKNTGCFRRCVVGKKIEKVERVGKNIIFYLSENKAVLIHQKISGHLLVGGWKKNKKSEVLGLKNNTKWTNEKMVPEKEGVKYLWDEKNRFIRFVFFFENTKEALKNQQRDKQMAFSDLRRFGKIICGTNKEVMSLPEIKKLGPDPLTPSFRFKRFEKTFKEKAVKTKVLLLDQRFIAGIGNIYADEILWKAKVHPTTPANKLSEKELKKVFSSTKKILKKAVLLKGTSTDDYRNPSGRKGGFGDRIAVYQKTGRPCLRCKTPIERIVVGGRGTHFCPECQKPDK